MKHVTYSEQMARRKSYADERERHKQRYLWLREHFRFANDSMQELWFDASIRQDGKTTPEELDRSIDAQMNPTDDAGSKGHGQADFSKVDDNGGPGGRKA